MNFNDLCLKNEYRTSSDELYKDFFYPMMQVAIKYDRAVGYFSSNVLVLLGQSLCDFINKDGKIRIVASPFLDEKDIEAIELGVKMKENLIEEKLLEIFEINVDNLFRETANVLAWLIAEEKLELKIATFQNGLYHEKFGIMYDKDENIVVFSGSANETFKGLKDNFESIDVYQSKNTYEYDRIKNKIENFEKLWSNTTTNLEVYDLPDAFINKILEYKTEEKPEKFTWISSIENDLKVKNGLAVIPSYLDVRDYQDIAYNKWRENKFKGIFEMATGTGKTITALIILQRTLEKLTAHNRGCLTIVLVPSIALASQWHEEMQSFNMNALVCESTKKWEDDFNMFIDDLRFSSSRHNYVILVNNSLKKVKDKLEDLSNSMKEKIFIIADEVHNLGTENYLKMLPSGIIMKLGLSATPQRYYDDSGTDKLKEYFGNIIYEFSMEEAIEKGVLTPYYYDVIPVSLTEIEYEEYYKISLELIRLGYDPENRNQKNMEQIERLLLKRARIIKLASNKITALKELLSREKDIKRSLFYVGEGTNIDAENKMINDVTKVLGLEFGLKINKYTSAESSENRKKILESFKKDRYQGLVAMKCLDEGVNIPSVEKAYILSSTTNPKEYIQRRGRVLRTSRETGKEFA